MLHFGLFRDVVLTVVGFFWCRAMFRRFQSDLEQLRTSVGVVRSITRI
jgi:hypothetical protein